MNYVIEADVARREKKFVTIDFINIYLFVTLILLSSNCTLIIGRQ